MSDLIHGKRITTETYYDGSVASTKQEIETDQFTDKQFILKEIIDLLGTINRGETTKLTIEVLIDKKNRYRLVSRRVI